jgi:hypothetical protein
MAFAFIIYINDLPLTPNTSSISIILVFAEDSNVIISSKNLYDFCILSNIVLSQMSKWFSADKTSLNLDKTNVIKFTRENSPQQTLYMGHNHNSLAYKLIII